MRTESHPLNQTSCPGYLSALRRNVLSPAFLKLPSPRNAAPLPSIMPPSTVTFDWSTQHIRCASTLPSCGNGDRSTQMGRIGHFEMSGCPLSTALSSSRSPPPDLRYSEPDRYTPGGKCTIPPASIARWIAAVSSAMPSPTAPKSLTSTALAQRTAAAIATSIAMFLMVFPFLSASQRPPIEFPFPMLSVMRNSNPLPIYSESGYFRAQRAL